MSVNETTEKFTRVIVHFYGTYRLISGKKEFVYKLHSGAGLVDLLCEIISDFPTLASQIFDEKGNLYSDIPIYVNGRNPRLMPQGVSTMLSSEDVISLFSPVASGKINVEAMNKALHKSKMEED